MLALVIVVVGLLWILGGLKLVTQLKPWLVTAAVILVVLPWLLAVTVATLARAAPGLGRVGESFGALAASLPSWVPALLGVGYVAAAVLLIRRRSPSFARDRERVALDRQHIRTRERVRVSPRGED